ncbi:MAG TPA: hypothetical protein VJT81_00295 [Burkholderiales bacterium]|nr:hypothetical protein [Burkholderiales bacterium]
MSIGRFLRVVLTALIAIGPAAADTLKDDAIARLAASHEPDIPLAVGRLAVKQAGLGAARTLLARRGHDARLGRGWNAAAPEWQDAEVHFSRIIDAVIARRIEDPEWLLVIWTDQAAGVLNAEEADEIATHFATAIGREQRVVVEVKVVGELLLSNYTFTDRISDRVPGSEREFARMQATWAEREPFRARNFDGDVGAARFGSRNPGVKYVRMLAIQGVHAIIAHIDAACAEAVRAVTDASAQADPFIEAWRRRTAN